jgi:EAL domain-containing protein (putative c-di-GMP-specific phosphodiesterase class I)
MGTDKESTGIIETILILADKLGKRAIAEGIETPGQLADLVAAGCDYGQGYLFSKPILPDVAEKLFFDQRDRDKSAGEYPGRDVELINEIYAM